MRQIFVNLPVKNLERSKTFFDSLGFSFDPKFTDDKAACMIIEKDSIYATLLKEEFCKTFIPSRAVADAKRRAREAKDHGFMYEHACEDPDGHIWELIHMRRQP